VFNVQPSRQGGAEAITIRNNGGEKRRSKNQLTMGKVQTSFWEALRQLKLSIQLVTLREREVVCLELLVVVVGIADWCNNRVGL